MHTQLLCSQHEEPVMSKLTKTRDMGVSLAAGLIAGATATWAMKQVQSFIDRKANIDPELEHAGPGTKSSDEVIVGGVSDKLGLDLTEAQRDQADKAMHWVLGLGNGLATAWVRNKTGAGQSLVRGTLLGVGTFVVVEEILKPAIGASRKPSELPWKLHARGLAGQAVYGLVNSGVRKTAARYLPM
jgi:hypothetical protein